MSKLKLKSKKNLSRTGRKSDKLKDVDTKSGQSQSKLFQFFDNKLESDKSGTCFKQTQISETTTSKYFIKSKDVKSDSNEDESFTDFQPEKVKKVSKVLLENKKETKKTKPVRRCKDKSDNLSQYTAEFEKVCTAGGIDVNPEHLQLAIAMSLSVNDAQNRSSVKIEENVEICTSGESSQSCYSEDDKVKRIRKTLLEYGFKVPIGPICTNPVVKRKRPTKYDKSLLLTRTADEKKQILSNAVSQIMLEDQRNKNGDVSNKNNVVSELYSSILNDAWCRDCSIVSKNSLGLGDMSDEYDIFYIRNLITPSDTKAGCLLKDWSKIPGRDPSPERTKLSLDFRENVLYDVEFDSMLSSCYSYIQNRIESIKHKSPSPKKSVTCVGPYAQLTGNKEIGPTRIANEIVVIKSRSCSPELFGENSYYGEDFGESNEYNEPVEGIGAKQSVQINESSNDSLPEVFVSQMSQPKNTTNFPVTASRNTLSTINEEVICVEEYGVRNITNTFKNLSDCSIDLTQRDFDMNDENCRKEPLFIDETASETSLDNSQELSNTIDEGCNDRLLLEKDSVDNVNKEDININTDCRVEICANVDTTNDANASKVIVKRKIASLGSIEDTIRFEEALKEYNLHNPRTENKSDITESIDLTDEDINADNDVFELSASQRLSQMYKNDNGVLHFESYHEVSTAMDLSDKSSPERNYVTLRNKNVHNLSDSFVDDRNFAGEVAVDSPKLKEDVGQSFHNVSVDIFDEENDGSFRDEPNCKSKKSKNVHNLSDSIISNDMNGDVDEDFSTIDKCKEISGTKRNFCMKSNTHDDLKEQIDGRSISLIDDADIEYSSTNDVNDIEPVNESEKEIDLTQSSNESDKKCKELNIVDELFTINGCAENTSPKKSLNNSDDVFVISDEEFNYSINASVKTKVSNAIRKDKSNCNALSESEGDSDGNDKLKAISDVNYDDYQVPNDFDLYGSSIFDQIPSYHASRISGMSQRKSCEVGLRKSAAIGNCSFDEFPNVVMPRCSYQKDTRSDSVINNNNHNIFNEVHSSKTNVPVAKNDNFLSPATKADGAMSKTKNADLKMQNHQSFTTDIAGCSRDSPVVKMTDFVKNLENTDDTPKNEKFIIKVDNVTPAQNYNGMDTPQVQKELSKYGLKPLKRKRAVQILEHIYNQTHPVVEGRDLEAKIKKRRLLRTFQNTSSPTNKDIHADNGVTNTEKENHHSNENVLTMESRLNLDEQGLSENVVMPSGSSEGSVEDIYKVDRLNVPIRQIDCDEDELYFQTREKSKILGCRVPLHVAFYNYISLRSRLHQAILTYHPVNIDIIHKGLVADGYRYNPKELFQFMDKKCITIKTTDKNGGSRQKKR